MDRIWTESDEKGKEQEMAQTVRMLLDGRIRNKIRSGGEGPEFFRLKMNEGMDRMELILQKLKKGENDNGQQNARS